MDKLAKDRIFAMGSLVLAIYLGYEAFGYPAKSALFPRSLSVLLAGLSGLFLLRTGFKKKGITKKIQPETSSCDTPSPAGEILALRSAGIVFGSIVAYGVLMGLVNYEASTVAFLAVMTLFLGFRKPVWILLFSTGFMFLLYQIFFQILGVPRPDSLFF